jgi:hypothetical protein
VPSGRHQCGGTAPALRLDIDQAFDTDLLSIVVQAMLAAFACALMLAVWTEQEK